MNIFLGYNGYKILTFINTLDKTTIKINWKLRLPLMNHSITTFSHLHRKKKDKIFKKANNYVVNKNLFWKKKKKFWEYISCSCLHLPVVTSTKALGKKPSLPFILPLHHSSSMWSVTRILSPCWKGRSPSVSAVKSYRATAHSSAYRDTSDISQTEHFILEVFTGPLLSENPRYDPSGFGFKTLMSASDTSGVWY